MVGDTGALGYFNTRLDSIQGLNYTSTATTDVFSLPSNISNITIMCDDNGDALGAESAVLIVLGKIVCAINFVLVCQCGIQVVVGRKTTYKLLFIDSW